MKKDRMTYLAEPSEAKDEMDFYRTAALYAMQGFIENPVKTEMAAILTMPKVFAEECFKIADAMLEKYRERKKNLEEWTEQ